MNQNEHNVQPGPEGLGPAEDHSGSVEQLNALHPIPPAEYTTPEAEQSTLNTEPISTPVDATDVRVSTAGEDETDPRPTSSIGVRRTTEPADLILHVPGGRLDAHVIEDRVATHHPA